MIKIIFKSIIFPMVLIPFALLFIAAKTTTTYQTECISLDNDGYISIKIWDTKKGKNYKPEEARKDAVHAILYSGIASAGNCTTQNPLLKNAEEQKKFKGIENDFFSAKGEWTRFTRSSATETTLPNKIGEKEWKVYQVSISKNELRKFLEEKSIIKSLNSGF